MPLGGEAGRGHRNNMPGLDSFDAEKKALGTGLWHQHQEISDALLVGGAGYLGQRVQTLRHAGEREESIAAMIMQWPLTQRIAREQQSPKRIVPERKRIVSNQTF